MGIMTREERISTFFESKKFSLKAGAWEWTNIGSGTFLVSIFISSGAMVTVCTLFGAGFGIIFAILFWSLYLFVTFRKNVVVRLLPDRIECEKKGKKHTYFFSDISWIKVVRTGMDAGAPQWEFYANSGEVLAPPVGSTKDGEDFSTFFRSNFPHLIWDQMETSGQINSLGANIMRLAALVIKSDGEISEEAQGLVIDYVWEHYYRSLSDQKSAVASRFHAFMAARQVDYTIYCRRIVESKKLDYWARHELVDLLFECAYVSAGINKVELQILREISNHLCLRPWHVASLEEKYECRKHEMGYESGNFAISRDERKRQAYMVLGLPDKASAADVKHAYHQLVKSCHPDKLSHKATSEEREQALVRFRSITEAYEYLCETL